MWTIIDTKYTIVATEELERLASATSLRTQAIEIFETKPMEIPSRGRRIAAGRVELPAARHQDIKIRDEHTC